MRTQIYPLPEKSVGVFGIIATGLIIAGIIIYFKKRNDEKEETTNFEIV